MSKEKKLKLPSIFSMAKSFTAELAKYVKEGAPNVSSENYIERLKICNACPFLIKEKMRCGKCGCLVEHKAKWKTTTCPEGKWKAQDLSDLPKPKAPQDEKK